MENWILSGVSGMCRKKELIKRSVLGEFEKRLRREWSIETGIIENVYTLDRGVTRTLIEKGIDAALIPHGATDRDSVLVARIIQDHYDALEGIFDFVGGQRQLSTSYVKELHAALLRNQNTHWVEDQFGRTFEKPLEKGVYKTAPNSPTTPDGTVHEYCPPEHVASEMDRLLLMYGEHQARAVPVPPEVEAAWFHHRFTQIHPFADGNGRVARAIASLVFIKAGWFPLIINRDDWTRYIDALEKADGDDLGPLVAMFVEAQRTALIQAAEVAFDVIPVASADEAIAAARDRLMHRGRLPFTKWVSAEKTANELVRFAQERFGQIVQELDKEIGSVGRGFHFDVRASNLRGESAVSSSLDDVAEYRVVVNLTLNTGRSEELMLTFFSVGPRRGGIIAVVPHLLAQASEPKLITGRGFLINYEEEPAKAQSRFSPWLEHVILEGLNEWRRNL